MPNNPMAERDRPSSFSQADSTEPIIINGKPLAIPKQKMLKKRLSLYVFIAPSKILPIRESSCVLSHVKGKMAIRTTNDLCQKAENSVSTFYGWQCFSTKKLQIKGFRDY